MIAYLPTVSSRHPAGGVSRPAFGRARHLTRRTNHTFLYTHLMRWEPLIEPGGQGNAWIKTLSKDTETGARTLLIKFDPGYKQMESATEWPADIYVLEGAMRCGEHTYQPSTFHYRPAGTRFGPIATQE